MSNKNQFVLPIFDEPDKKEPLPQGIDAVVHALRNAGAPLEVALCSGGFTMSDYSEWLDDESKQELVATIKKAEADFCIRALKQVVNSADMGDTKSAQWLLERRFPNMFGRPNKVSTSQVIDKESAIEVESIGTDLLSEITEEDFRLMAVEVLRRKMTTHETVSDSD